MKSENVILVIVCDEEKYETNIYNNLKNFLYRVMTSVVRY